jgi:CheY-like chemotaxis protein
MTTSILNRAEGNGGLKCVLLVEDDTNDALMACRELSKLKLRNPVRRVQMFAEMVDYLKGEGQYAGVEVPTPAVIVTDMRLPGGDGLQLQAWLRSTLKYKQIPIIAISSAERITQLRTAVDLGANAWMTKPFNGATFRQLAAKLRLELEFAEAPKLEVPVQAFA